MKRLYIGAGTIKRVHVNRHILARNGKTGERAAPLTIQTSKGPRRAHEVTILGPSVMVYPAKPLKCGAKVWVETMAAIEYVEL